MIGVALLLAVWCSGMVDKTLPGHKPTHEVHVWGPHNPISRVRPVPEDSFAELEAVPYFLRDFGR